VDAIVLEVADGILQCETAALLESAAFSACVGTVLFAAGDAMGAVAGAGWLRTRNLALAGFSGVLTAAPLQREECSKATGLPSYTRRDLARPATAATILACATTPFSRGNGSRATLVEEDVS